jgi:gamma-aminobutyric acid type B receptor
VAPDSSHNPARIAFIRRFGWDTVTTFSQNEEIHSLAVNDLVTELERANISCAATITFAETDFKDQLKMLRVSLCRMSIKMLETLNFCSKEITFPFWYTYKIK